MTDQHSLPQTRAFELADESDAFDDAKKRYFARVCYIDLSEDEDAGSEILSEDSYTMSHALSHVHGDSASGPVRLLKRPSAWNLADLSGEQAQSSDSESVGAWQSAKRSLSIMDFLAPGFTGLQARQRPRSFSYEGSVDRPVPSLICLDESNPFKEFEADDAESQMSIVRLASSLRNVYQDPVRHFMYEEVDESDVLKSAISAYFADEADCGAIMCRLPGHPLGPGPLTPTLFKEECASVGLRACEVQAAKHVYGSNQLPVDLPDVPLATCRAIAYVFALRPAAFVTGALASLHLAWGIVPHVLTSAARTQPRALLLAAATLGLSATVIGTSRFLEHYLSAFDRLREHVRLAQYALHRVRNGEEEEELTLVLREGVKAWVPCSALVPGDVLHLAEGRVPADCKLIEAHNLKLSCSIAEMPFQSNVPIVFSTTWWSSGKGAAAEAARTRLPNADAPCALGASEDSEQIALSTSIVTSGKATAIVTRTGKCSGAYLLLSRLSSLSLLEVIALYGMGGVPPHPTRGQWRM